MAVTYHDRKFYDICPRCKIASSVIMTFWTDINLHNNSSLDALKEELNEKEGGKHSRRQAKRMKPVACIIKLLQSSL
jgi:hypothetical protein